MKKSTIKKLIIVGAVFIVAAVIAVIVINARSGGEVSYVVSPEPSLPVVTLKSEGLSINTLYGYIDREVSDEAYESITPLLADHKLPIEITTSSEKVTGISYEIRSIDGSDLIENSVVEGWSETESGVSGVLPIKDILEDGVEYRLVIKLTTDNSKEACYYTRIVYSEDYKVKEMMEYVQDFHASTFSASKAEKYAVNWEVDGSMDTSTLAHVNIHSTFDQLTYSNLAPEEVGDPVITILEMDKTFASFLIRSVIKATDEEGADTEYYVEEFFCVQWSELRFYLMSYDRYMTQIFEAQSSNIKEGELVLGVADEDNISLTKSDAETYLSFVMAGDLWLYSADESEIIEVYSAAENKDIVYRAKRDYDIKVVDVDDEGNVSFIVYGYMNSGAHEGKSGLSYLVYNKEKNVLDELLFINTEKDCETIGIDLDELLMRNGKKTYFLCDDSVFELDEETKETTCLVEGAAAHGLRVSEDGKAIAWAEGNLTHPKQLQIRYLSNGQSHSISASEGEYVKAVGFSGDDFAYSKGREDDAFIFGFEKIEPQYALVIIDNAGNEIISYEKTGILIRSVKVAEGQIIISRIKQVGDGYEAVDDDTMMQNENVVEEKVSPFETKTVSSRGKILYLKNSKAGSKARFRVSEPEQISNYDGEIKTQTDDDRILYYAYSLGHLRGKFEEANEAIKAVYDDMGYVSASNGYRVWHRKAKEVTENSIRLPEIEDGITDKLEGDLTAMITLAKGNVDVKNQLASGLSAREALEKSGVGITANLEGCTLKQIYYFIEKGYPVLALDKDGEAVLITGYDKYNIIVYDPIAQDTHYVGENDAKELIEEPETRMIALIW